MLLNEENVARRLSPVQKKKKKKKIIKNSKFLSSNYFAPGLSKCISSEGLALYFAPYLVVFRKCFKGTLMQI